MVIIIKKSNNENYYIHDHIFKNDHIFKKNIQYSVLRIDMACHEFMF